MGFNMEPIPKPIFTFKFVRVSGLLSKSIAQIISLKPRSKEPIFEFWDQLMKITNDFSPYSNSSNHLLPCPCLFQKFCRIYFPYIN